MKITKIADATDEDQKYLVEGTVESISKPREVFSKKDGKYHQVADVILMDTSGKVKLVLWNDMIRQIKVNERIRIEPAYPSIFRDELQLNVSKYGRIAILIKREKRT